MNFRSEYIYYNDVVVQLFGDYTVSLINTKGLPKPDIDFKDAGPHLISLTIEPPKSGSNNNPESVGTTGTVQLTDYKNVLFNKFTKYVEEQKSSKDRKPQPPICITINCYTGKYTYVGLVTEWKLQFTGGTPTYSLIWKAFGATATRLTPQKIFGIWRKPSEFLTMAKKYFAFGQKFDFIFKKNGEKIDDIDSIIQFKKNEVGDSEVAFDLTGRTLSGNILLDSYLFLADNVVTTNGDPVVGEIPIDNLNVFEARPNNDEENAHKTDETDICNNLVFILNGKYPAYKKERFSDGKERVVIPMTDFSFDTDSTSIWVQFDIAGNQNGVFVASTNAKEQSNVTEGTESAAETVDGITKQSDVSSKTSIEFDCYNVMSFDRNNTSSKIKFIVYTEFGEIHPVSGAATVKEVSYDLSGAVVKAHVKATKEYNSIGGDTEPIKPINSQDNTDEGKSGE